MKHTVPYKTWIEVDTFALRSNWQAFRTLIPEKTAIMAVAKANAYGHGLVPFVKTMSSLGVQMFGVDSLSDARILREAGIKERILVLGYTFPEEYDEAVSLNVALTLSSHDGLSHCAIDRGRPVAVHIKVDTGMHGQGFLPSEKEAVLEFAKRCKDTMRIEGVYTQFASTRQNDFLDYTMGQIETFDAWQDFFQKAGVSCVRHTSATTGAIMYPAGHFDMVRIGAGLYGLWPSSELAILFKEKLALHEALTWKTVVGDVKHLPQGERIGYDLTHELSRDSVLAILPIGYSSGYARSLSNKGYVLIRGKKAPIVGRISMDTMSVDVTDIPDVEPRDVVTLIGEDGEEKISIYEYADMVGQGSGSHYESLVRINPNIPRIFV